MWYFHIDALENWSCSDRHICFGSRASGIGHRPLKEPCILMMVNGSSDRNHILAILYYFILWMCDYTVSLSFYCHSFYLYCAMWFLCLLNICQFNKVLWDSIWGNLFCLIFFVWMKIVCDFIVELSVCTLCVNIDMNWFCMASEVNTNKSHQYYRDGM